VSLSIEKGWRMGAEGGKISGWWQCAESLLPLEDPLTSEEKDVYSAYTLRVEWINRYCLG
jgi:hypothetical protein